jgi:hypothetical protein
MTTTEERVETPGLTADKCHCEFKKDLELHDLLVGIERLSVPFAAQLVSMLIADDDMGTGASEPLFNDPDDFGRFVMQHNWSDPVSMALLASSVDHAMNKIWPANIAWRARHQ